MSIKTKYALVGLMFCSPVVLAENYTVESSVTLASQYLFRGFDMTQDNPAVQGDYIISNEQGFWFGAWASNYDIGSDDGVEIDIIGGYNIALSDEVTLGFGFTEYTYTGEVDSSTEYNVSISYNQFSLSYYDDVDLNTTYISLDSEFQLSDEMTVAFHLAEYDYESADSSRDYSATLNYSMNEDLSVSGTYSVNDIGMPGAENYFVASISYSF